MLAEPSNQEGTLYNGMDKYIVILNTEQGHDVSFHIPHPAGYNVRRARSLGLNVSTSRRTAMAAVRQHIKV